MKLKWMSVLTSMLFSLVILGCSGREDSSEIACTKLELKCSKSDNILNYELNKKIEAFVDKRELNIQNKIKTINDRLEKFSARSFQVDVTAYSRIPEYRNYGSETQEKIDGVKIYSSSADLFESAIKVREGLGKASRYMAISNECKKLEIIKCKIAYTGKIYAVWTKKSEESGASILSGWIEIEDVISLPVNLNETKDTIRSLVKHEVQRLIGKSKGDVSWLQIENLVDEKIEKIK